jgi:hypothetical protein
LIWKGYAQLLLMSEAFALGRDSAYEEIRASYLPRAC